MHTIGIWRKTYQPVISRVFSLGWVYDIPRWWKISGWQIAGLVRVQAGDAVLASQATNNNSSLGYAVQRPNRVSAPERVRRRSVAKFFNTAAFTNAPQFVIGTKFAQPVRGPGLQNADLMIGKTFRITELREPRIPHGGFQRVEHPSVERSQWNASESAAFGSIYQRG